MAPKPKEIIRFIGRSSKRIAVTVVGAAVVAGGLAMLVLPGPGILVIAVGFAILGTEYAWAAAAFEKTKRSAERAGRVAKGAVGTASGRVRRRPFGGGPKGAGPQGAGPQGAGPQGAGPQGAGPLDAGSIEAGPQGAGLLGAGPLDAGSIEAGPLGAGPTETGPSGAAPPAGGSPAPPP